MIHICRKALTKEKVFDEFVSMIDEITTSNLKGLKCLRSRKGELWEEFCKSYMLNIKHCFASVKLLAELSDEELQSFGLSRRDVGIDMVAVDPHGKQFAIQCKFRSKGVVSWRELSTFYALCARSGPWEQHIVMTNAKSVRREGQPSLKDKSICYNSFANLHRHEWYLLGELGKGSVCVQDTVNALSPMSLRKKRLEKFEQSKHVNV